MQVLEPQTHPLGAVLILHSWWGLTESFLQYGTALAASGFRTGLADLYDGHVAKTVAQARALRRRPRRIPIYKSLAADIGALRCEGGGDLKVGVVGFSMGGHWAIWLSQRPEYDISATILYYAARAGSFEQKQGNILAHFAEKDDWVSPSTRKKMERAVSESKYTYRSYNYPGTQHWFAESSRGAEFDALCAEKALERDIEFLRATLTN